MPPVLPPLPTSIVGSLPQPEWLVEPAEPAGQFPPRVRAREIWRVAPELLPGAQDDATQLAIRAQEEAPLDIVTDGGIRRESYSNHVATALDGADVDCPDVVRGEIADLFAAGADLVQIDEPWLQAAQAAAVLRRELG